MAIHGVTHDRAAVSPSHRRVGDRAQVGARARAASDRRDGWRVTVAPVDHDGRVDLDALAGTIGDDTALVSVMAANNEIGVLQPLAEIAAIAHAHGAPVSRRRGAGGR